ncbi:MAG: cobaltochelatase subunit CobN, partial [Candidatus Puniceispirillum sp.]
PPARPLLRAGLYWPDCDLPDFGVIQSQWQDQTKPVAALVFYRALVQAGDLAPINGLINACVMAGMNPLPVFASSLKEEQSAGIVAECLATAKADVILNMTSFAVSDPSALDDIKPDAPIMRSAGPFGVVDAPVFQVVLASNRMSDWQDNAAGLTARDLAMNVALPELDGRILSRAIAFKKPLSKDPVTHAMTTHYVLVPERASFVATLAAKWCALRHIKPADKKVALILANYPNKDGRIANGVGLDTPESAFQAMRDLQTAGYRITDLPDTSAGLISTLRKGPTNAGWQGREAYVTLARDVYDDAFASLPDDVRDAVTDRWGAADQDPMFDGKAFRIPVQTFGHAAVGIQPARGYNIDPKATYHAPDLVPPHNYFAFYIWLRDIWGMDAVIHFGKHGNLEWLPGKALA